MSDKLATVCYKVLEIFLSQVKSPKFSIKFKTFHKVVDNFMKSRETDLRQLLVRNNEKHRVSPNNLKSVLRKIAKKHDWLSLYSRGNYTYIFVENVEYAKSEIENVLRGY